MAAPDRRTSVLDWTSSSRTDVGRVRQHNEDACLDRPEAGLWVVADGMGGHAAGDVASAMVVERLRTLDPGERLSDAVERVEAVLDEVNTELRRLAISQQASAIGSTVAVLLAREQHAVCMWAGDSRIYRLRAGALEQVTQDHAPVADLLDRGLLTAEQAASHPQAHMVSRAVGAGNVLKLDLEIVRLQPGDRFVLCSDGLDKEVDPGEIRDLVAHGCAVDAADALVELALSRGARDNVTVIAVWMDGAPDGGAYHAAAAPEEESDDTLPGFTAGQGRAGQRRH